MKKYFAEFIGTAALTLLGCGTAVFVGCGTPAGVAGTALAFGLSVVAMAYAIGGISGCHINPAITLGVALSGRMGIHRCSAHRWRYRCWMLGTRKRQVLLQEV